MHGLHEDVARRVDRCDAGMTLLELMIAAGIMAMGMVFLMGSMANISHTGASSEERAIASSHMATILEELGRANVDTLFDYQPPAFRGLARERVTISCVDATGALVNLPVNPATLGAAIPNPAEVRVTITWRSRGGHPHRVTATTFLRL